MNKIMEKMSSKPSSSTFLKAFLKMKKSTKEGVHLLDIAKKLSSKKFGK